MEVCVLGGCGGRGGSGAPGGRAGKGGDPGRTYRRFGRLAKLYKGAKGGRGSRGSTGSDGRRGAAGAVGSVRFVAAQPGHDSVAAPDRFAVVVTAYRVVDSAPEKVFERVQALSILRMRSMDLKSTSSPAILRTKRSSKIRRQSSPAYMDQKIRRINAHVGDVADDGKVSLVERA